MSLFAPQSFTKFIQDRDEKGVSSIELLARSRNRIDDIETEVHAFANLAGHTQEPLKGPLSGIAVGVKDIFDTFDLATEYGSAIYQGYLPKVDAAIVSMLRAKGASIIGKTTTTEFAFFKPTKTKNTNNLEYSPGGSSAGSAAAVASGMVTAAIGTQTGGSIIRPASFCGVTGYKPSYRILPTTGMKYFAQTLDTAGLFAKSVSDVAHFASLLTDRDLAVVPINPKDIRVGIYRNDILSQASSDMTNALHKATKAASSAGFDVVEIDEPSELRDAHNIHEIIQCFEAAQTCRSDLDLFEHLLSDKLKATLIKGMAITPQEYDSTRRIAKKARKATRPLYDKVDVLLTPSAPGAAPIGFDTTGIATFNKLWTLIGSPCVNISGFHDTKNMPLGIQAVGRFGDDKRTLSIASSIEDCLQ